MLTKRGNQVQIVNLFPYQRVIIVKHVSFILLYFVDLHRFKHIQPSHYLVCRCKVFTHLVEDSLLAQYNRSSVFEYIPGILESVPHNLDHQVRVIPVVHDHHDFDETC